MFHRLFKGTAILFAGMLISCHTSKPTAKSVQAPTHPIVVDGYNNDWPSPYPYSDINAMISYAITNDANNLYLTIETNNPKGQLKILNAGMSVWIDTTGAQNRKTAIIYPAINEHAQIPVNRMSGEHSTGEDQDTRIQMRAKSLLEDARELTLEGFRDCNTSFNIDANNFCKIKVRVAIDSSSNNMVWEASIPFKALLGKDQIDKKDAEKPMSIGIEINGFEMPDRIRKMAPKLEADSSSQMGRRFAQMKNLFDRTSTWKQFNLAYK